MYIKVTNLCEVWIQAKAEGAELVLPNTTQGEEADRLRRAKFARAVIPDTRHIEITHKLKCANPQMQSNYRAEVDSCLPAITLER